MNEAPTLPDDPSIFDALSPHVHDIPDLALQFPEAAIDVPSQGEINEPPIQEEVMPEPYIPPLSASPTVNTDIHNDPQLDSQAGTSSQHTFTNTPDEHHTDADNNYDSEDLEVRLKPRSRHPPQRYGDWIRYDNNRSNTGSAAYIVSQPESITEPKTYKEAMQSPHAQQWKEAMAKEFASLQANKHGF